MKIEKELEKGFISKIERLRLGLLLLTLFGLALITACGGGGGDETSLENQTREVTGIVSEGTAKGISKKLIRQEYLL